MSNPQTSAIDRNNLYRIQETKNKNQSFKIQTDNNNFRDLVLDFVLNESLKTKQKPSKKSNKDKDKFIDDPNKGSNKQLKKMIIQLHVSLNDQITKIEYNAFSLIEKFLQEQRKNEFEQTNIQTLVTQILTFVQQIQSQAQKMEFNFGFNQQRLNDKVIDLILHNYFKQKSRLNRLKDLDILKSKTIKNYQNLHNQSQFQKQSSSNQLKNFSRRISRDIQNLPLLQQNSQLSTNSKKNNKSQLKDLVNNFNVFQHPQKLQKLKNQKIKQLYDGLDIDDITHKSKNQFSNLVDKTKSQNNDDTQFLVQWITQIDISEKLFYKKLQTKQKKQKSNQVKVGKIVEQYLEEGKDLQSSKDSF